MADSRKNTLNSQLSNPEYVSYFPDYSSYDYDQVRGLSGIDAADRLQQIIEHAKSWPIWSADHAGGIDTGTYPQAGQYGQSLRDIALWIAMREHDREQLVRLTNWERDRPLHVDPLPERMSEAYSDLLYGENPDFYAADRDDQDQMDEMVDETALTDELPRWVDLSVSEGEMWWRAWTDSDASDWPIVEGKSRINTIPLFVGRKIVAVAFTDDILSQEIHIENQTMVVFWRHIEIHTVGYVRNLLYKGTVGGLGSQMPLSSLAETAHLEEDWDHGLPIMLAGRVPRKLGRDFRLGVSIYQGVRDLLMDLNEARTIMAENARLVLKARMIVPQNALDAEGNFDASQDTIVQESLDEELAGKAGGSYSVLEYTFRASELIQHKNELTLDIMSRCGLAEQFAQQGRGGEGQAFTGTALRTKLVPTVQAAKGIAKPWDREVPKILRALAMLSALPIERGGCGQEWKEADGKHIQQRSNLLPEDQNEKVQRHVMAVQGEVESIQAAVEDLHGDEWDEDQIRLEVMRIARDRSKGPEYVEPGKDPDDLEEEWEQEDEPEPPPPGATGPIPNVPPGGPGSSVPRPQDVVGSDQPGAAGTPPRVDGQSPGNRPPRVTAGGPR